MGIFSRILDKLRGHSGGAAAAQPGQGQAAGTSNPQGQPSPQAAAPSAATPASSAGGSPQQLRDVDVEAVLAEMAKKKGGGGNYRESIVDLLKLLDLDSSLDARKELARELGVNAGAHGSAEQNIALQKAVMRELAKNGGKVPQSLRD